MKAELFDLCDIVGEKWRDLADRLNMSRYDVEMIELEVHTKKERAFKMLKPGEKIDEYHQRFLLYCTTNNIVDTDKMKAIFLTTVGGTTYSILLNLVSPARPQVKTLDKLITLLKNHYEPRKIANAERFKFYKRQQKEGESIANYVAELRRLAKDCEFADSLNTVLRDQLVCGLRHEGLQQKVLAERDLTLGKALSLTQAHETARHELKLLRGEPQSSRQTYQAAETAFTVQASGGRRFTPRDSTAKERVCHRCD